MSERDIIESFFKGVYGEASFKLKNLPITTVRKERFTLKEKLDICYLAEQYNSYGVKISENVGNLYTDRYKETSSLLLEEIISKLYEEISLHRANYRILADFLYLRSRYIHLVGSYSVGENTFITFSNKVSRPSDFSKPIDGVRNKTSIQLIRYDESTKSAMYCFTQLPPILNENFPNIKDMSCEVASILSNVFREFDRFYRQDSSDFQDCLRQHSHNRTLDGTAIIMFEKLNQY